MKAVDLYQNSDGSWTARIFNLCFKGTKAECISWLRANGESEP